jgi:hypothetical protein
MMPASVGRIKASAGALPLARLSALTRPADAGFGWPSDRRLGMSMLLVPGLFRFDDRI